MPDTNIQRSALSIVIPCYNEEGAVRELHRRLAAVCGSIAADYEIVLVDDGSRDSTWQLMEGLSHQDSHVVAVRLSRNHGHQLALTAGLSICSGQRILIIDADLQDPPELLPEMIEFMDAEKADVVYGQRIEREGESTGKLLTAFLFYRIIQRLTETPIPADTGDFRLMTRRALDVLIAMPERHRFIRGMVSWIGFKQVPFPYQRLARHSGVSKYPFRKMLRFALDAVTGFSTRPLAIASYAGLCSAGLSLLMVGWAVYGWWTGGTIQGWASLLAAIGLLGSAQLIVLGIIGEYLGRLYEQSKGRPLFIIQDVVRGTDVSQQANSPGEPI